MTRHHTILTASIRKLLNTTLLTFLWQNAGVDDFDIFGYAQNTVHASEQPIEVKL